MSISKAQTKSKLASAVKPNYDIEYRYSIEMPEWERKNAKEAKGEETAETKEMGFNRFMGLGS